MKKIFLFLYTLAIVSCQPSTKEPQLQEKIKQDSIAAVEATKAAKEAEKAARKEDSLKMYSEAKRDSASYYSDIDCGTTSQTIYYFDNNNVEWKAEEENKFRFVYFNKLSKFIVYKDKSVFKEYYHAVISPKLKPFDFMWCSNLTMISVNGQPLFKPISAKLLKFAPNGFDNYTEYYILDNW